ncbi:MAG: putative membrane protein [Lentisphaeria bacterium]|jgi:uncharacterized membrane protein
MPAYLHYPNSSCSLNDFAKNTCVNPIDIATYTEILKATNRQIANPDGKYSNSTPFIIPQSDKTSDISIPVCSFQQHETLKHLSMTIGGAGVMAVADLLWETKIPDYVGDMNTFGGNGIGAAASSSNFVLKDIAHYDKLLKEFHDLKNHSAAQATLSRKEAELKRAFNKMNSTLNTKGQQLLHKYAFKTKEVVNQTGRVVRESIPISSMGDVQKLTKFAGAARVAGPGFIVLDGYLRANDVHSMYKAKNSQWKRQAVVQSTAFAAGIAAGIIIGIIFAPITGSIIITLAVAGTVGLAADYGAKSISGKLYDGLTK